MISVVSPYPVDSQIGNSVSARRIVALLNSAGIKARATFDAVPPYSSAMVAINAWRLSEIIHQFRNTHPNAPIIVVLAGSDLYGTKSKVDAANTRRAMVEASSLVVSQSAALDAVPDYLQSKCKVIPKSVNTNLKVVRNADPDFFNVIIASNLRQEKEPLVSAQAAAMLPTGSRIRMNHYGIALDQDLATQALALTNAPHSRYTWHDGIPHGQVLTEIVAADLFVNSSRFEGGANAVCEAIALGTPVLATRIPGNIGILGLDYPGLFPTGDTKALTGMLVDCEQEAEFLEQLTDTCARLAPAFAPEYECRLWMDLLGELTKH